MRRASKLVAISLPAAIAAVLLLLVSVEIWTRAHWDDRKGTPGFFLSDPVRIQRLAAGYRGWFAGVPVSINSLELRDDREYLLEKSPRTFRILVLGDSVTFGHGSVYEHSYPYLLEQKLKAWNPEVDWQVWNAAVPGYNTSQELAQLLEVGPRYQPDLVIVGFYENDAVGNYAVTAPTAAARMRSAVLSWAYRHIYSTELFKRLYLQIAWRMSRSTSYRQRLAHVAEEERLIVQAADVRNAAAQRITAYDVLTDEQLEADRCPSLRGHDVDMVDAVQREPGWPDWVNAVRRFQALHAARQYPVLFFVNVIPAECPGRDVFYDGGTAALNRFYMRYLGAGTPAVSVYDAFRHVRPSQMPEASGHALGNANVVKADVLFDYLRDHLLPPPGARRAAAEPRSRP